MTMQEEEPLCELWDRIESGTTHSEDDPKRVVSAHEEVVVVADDHVSTKNTIRMTESLISHANNHYGQDIDFNIAPLPASKRAVEASCGFHMSLERTPRMPDDNKLHQLPGSLGSYDLFSVEAYADRLPDNITESGGVLFPMWQREAMWLNFGPTNQQCAVRVFMGHVNTISGLTMEETADEKSDELEQDYIVLPGQEWLDGICVGPGVVRQFVAMPLGSGYTVEGQKTSKEQHGGLQLEITPEFLPDLRLWSDSQHDYILRRGPGPRDNLSEKETPEGLGCKAVNPQRSSQNTSEIEQKILREVYLKKWEEQMRMMQNTSPVNPLPIIFNQPGQHADLQGNTDIPAPTMQASMHGYTFIDESNLVSNGIGGWNIERHDLAVDMDREDVGRDDREDIGGEDGIDNLDLQVIETKNIKAMGLAAGGKLIQDIYKDPYPPTMWNHAAARILHVHILDPGSCEKVTHIVPTPPSIDVKAYTEAGGQYFVVEEKVDERLDGGDFDNVKSVSQMDQHIGISTEPEFDPTKPKMCTTCELRLCDCIIRPCDHQFCNICIKRIEQNGNDEDVDSAHRNWKCPTCDSAVSHVAGFSAPMNLPGEEPLRVKVPVNVLKIEDGRMRFTSVQRSRV
ncbi:uncharacterized protein J4E88_000828 [Alternaria novae-zelandiae]|uniref:uncharacterized protein n=1 Tax=Alternaria novae-zelandiae TaxID=430562 RepID=UPI0020C3A0B6|nr:uncharacterized protein J4E88_000828 [Alternaria novae-zelandiae]KAI4696651.1 hypothetical protein J4E88_000828 [Alternaria novae-zelandiae]